MCWLVISEGVFPLMDEMSQSFMVRAFSMVSAVVKVLLTTITRVSSGFSLFTYYQKGGGGVQTYTINTRRKRQAQRRNETHM